MTVRDWGSGIPVGVMADQGLPALTVVLTKLHAGGKFGGDGYKVSGGLHGVGVSVVNALSEWLVAEVRRDGKVYRQEFARGDATTEVDGDREGRRRTTPGRRSPSCPTPTSSRSSSSSAQMLTQRFSETAFLTKGLRIVFVDEREGEETQEFYAEGGIRDFVAFVNETKDAVHTPHRLLRGRERPGRRRGGDAVEHLVRRVGLLVREQHQHPRGRHAPLRLQGGAHRHTEQVRARQGPPEGEGGQPRGRGRPRGSGRGHLRQASRPAVRGADEDQAGEPLGARSRRADRQREAGRVPRGEPHRRAPDRPEGDLGVTGPPGGAEGARADAAEERARELVASRQARRLHDPQPGGRRALHRRRRLGWRLGEDGRATAPSRRSFRSAARSSTARRTASTRCSRTTRSRR